MTGGEILGYFKNGQLRGFGGGAPDCGVQGPQVSAGGKGRSPFSSLSPLNADFIF